MKVNFILAKTQAFKGVREDRNTVSQLRNDNDYSLTEPNQRRINKAIENLAKQRGEENIRFLLDVGENLKYQTNTNEKNIPVKNNWNAKLKGAAEESLAHSNPILKSKYQPEIDRVFASDKPASKPEEDIAAYRESIMKRLKKSEYKNNIEKNLDYFVASSETPIEQKKYVLKRLDYFMSPKYKINKQLEDKKDKVLSEMLNDLSLTRDEHGIPNIKAINQKTHGMCAAIAITRKAIAYEDKPNYVDAILSELDNTDNVMIYDRQNLGSKKRVPVKKAYIDFDYAQERGYRIVDASTLQWMNIGGMFGVQNESLHDFNAFDKNNFDAFHDAFFTMSMADEKLKEKQAFFQALTKAKDNIGSVKSGKIKSDIRSLKKRQARSENIDSLSKRNTEMRSMIEEIAPNALKASKEIMFNDLMRLAQPISSDISKLPKEIQKYAFIPNEEASQKEKKIKSYFTESYGAKNIKQDVLDKKAGAVVDTLEDINEIAADLSGNKSMPSKVANARRLYEAEAIYRASMVLGINESDNRDDLLISYNIPDRETRISKGFDTVIDRIEKKNDKKLLEHFAPCFETTPDDKATIVQGLKDTKATVDYLMTDVMDDLYAAVGCGNRQEMLVNDMNDCIEAVKSGDKDELNRIATCMGIKADKNKVLNGLEKLKDAMMKDPTNQEAYVEAFNKMGYKAQIDAYVDVFNVFTKNVTDFNNPEREVYISAFKEANGLGENATNEEVFNVLGQIGAKFNLVSQTVAQAANLLEVENSDGTPYHTVSAHDLLLGKMEKEGKLIPVSTMKKLQERFAKIDKIRSSDEFASRQGKISDPSLYQMSAEEKKAVKQIDKKINMMYSDVSRQLDRQYREIKEPLSELSRYVGTNIGKYWVPKDGDSGLFDDQQVKIFEQITGRPHRAVEDIEKGIKLIKEGPHSGVSGSSVFHDRMGGHAMYIADIVKDEKTGKEILYHDNTWGPSEHENTWVDSDGLTRTDYSDHRGGIHGYVTNKDYRNGNIVEELTKMKGHVSPDTTESKVYKHLNPSAAHQDWDFQLMSRIILDGNDPDYKDIAASIRDDIFFPDNQYVDTLGKHASNMSKQELQKRMFRNLTVGKGYEAKFDEIIKRITPTSFNKGIASAEDYAKLPDNDIVKIAFEKAAIRRAYPDAPMYDEVADAKTMDDLKKVKAAQRRIAKEDFKYAFGKNKQILLHVYHDKYKDLSTPLLDALKNNKVQWDLEGFRNVLKNVTVYEKDEKHLFTGSMKDSIDFVVNKAGRQYDKNIKKSENSEKAKEEFLTNLRKNLEKDLYFDKEDLNIQRRKARVIRAWIDDKFQPVTDEQFVEIYRQLQDMPSNEFMPLTKNLTDKDMGMRSVTGYDILNKVQNADESAETLLRNTVYYDYAKGDINWSKTKKSYKFRKLERNSRGVNYIGDRTFDDLYRSMHYSLSSLEYERMFNKHREMAYKNYGVMPAYPKIDLSDDEGITSHIAKTEETVLNSLVTLNSQKNYIYDIKLAHMLDNYRNSIPENRKLKPEEQMVLTRLLMNFAVANAEDSDFNEVIDSIHALLEKDGGATIADYNDSIDTIVNTIAMMENVNKVEDFEESNRSYVKGLNNYFNTILEVNIPPKYQRLVREDFNNWINLERIISRQTNGLDRNKDVIDLMSKVCEHSSKASKKSQIEDLMRIVDTVDAYKLENSKNKRDAKLIDLQIGALHELSDAYLDKYTKPESKTYLKSQFNDWYRKELAGGQERVVYQHELDNAKRKFEEDFKKHHYTSHPTEVLDNWLLTQVNDTDKHLGKIALKSYLETMLNMAKNVAIQDELMEAVQQGNAAHVKEYFDDYRVAIDSDTVVSMDSDEAIDYMVRSLILNKNPETAKMFVEKLGLGDRVLKIERKTIENVDAKGKIDEIAKILKESHKLTSIVKADYDDLAGRIDDMDSIRQVVIETNKTKRSILENTKYSEDKKLVRRMIKALDDGVMIIKAKPDVTKSVIMSTAMNEAFSDVNEEYNSRISEKQSYVNVVNVIYSFLKTIQLPANSKAKALQDQIAQEHEDLAKYNNDVIEAIAAENPSIHTVKKAYS